MTEQATLPKEKGLVGDEPAKPKTGKNSTSNLTIIEGDDQRLSAVELLRNAIGCALWHADLQADVLAAMPSVDVLADVDSDLADVVATLVDLRREGEVVDAVVVVERGIARGRHGIASYVTGLQDVSANPENAVFYARQGRSMLAGQRLADDLRRRAAQAEHGASLATLRRNVDGDFAKAYGPGELIPLETAQVEVDPYPTDALGPILGPMAEACVADIQCAPAMAANCLLAAASLACQGLANVIVDKLDTPLSVYSLVVAESGERKSSTDRAALRPHAIIEKELLRDYSAMDRDFQQRSEMYRRLKDKTMKAAKSVEEGMDALASLGDEPISPPKPILRTADTTMEAVVDLLATGRGSLGLFTSEAGIMLSGHAAKAENRLRTLALLSDLFDGEGMTTSRRGTGVVSTVGKRVCLSWMMQPAVAPRLYADPEALGQGILWRCLPAWPESLAGKRTYSTASVYDSAAYAAYEDRMLDLLRREIPYSDSEKRIIEPTRISFSDKARAMHERFFNSIEKQSGEGGPLAAIRSFAIRAAEHTRRIAGVLAMVADPDGWKVSGEVFEQAVTLVDWYLAMTLRIVDASDGDDVTDFAKKVLAFLQAEGEAVHFSRLNRSGPRRNGKRSAMDYRDALELLVSTGHVRQSTGDRWEASRAIC